MPDTPQSYSNHTRWDPPFHFFVLPIAGIVFFGILYHSIRHVMHDPGVESIVHGLIHVVLGAALLVLVVRVRTYPLKVQDRVIRLEERLRLATLLPENLRSRIPELTERQLVALRFASDAEVSGLAQRAMNERLAPDAIKKAIQNWRADNWRV